MLTLISQKHRSLNELLLLHQVVPGPPGIYPTGHFVVVWAGCFLQNSCSGLVMTWKNKSCWASFVCCQHDATHICYLCLQYSACSAPAAIHQYFLHTGHSAANLLVTIAAVTRWDSPTVQLLHRPCFIYYVGSISNSVYYVSVTVHVFELVYSSVSGAELCVGADPDDVDTSEPPTAPAKQVPSKFVCHSCVK